MGFLSKIKKAVEKIDPIAKATNKVIAKTDPVAKRLLADKKPAVAKNTIPRRAQMSAGGTGPSVKATISKTPVGTTSNPTAGAGAKSGVGRLAQAKGSFNKKLR